MTGFEAILAAAGAASGIISALAVMVISGGSPRLVVWAAAAVWAATAAVIILDLNALQTALAITVACAPSPPQPAGRRRAGRRGRTRRKPAGRWRNCCPRAGTRMPVPGEPVRKTVRKAARTT